MKVFPIVATSCAWTTVEWLRRVGVRPQNAKPVWRDDGKHANEELTEIVTEIYNLLPTLKHIDDSSGEPTIQPDERIRIVKHEKIIFTKLKTPKK